MATANAAGLYRPRRPERTVLYRVLAQHFERFVQVYDERFASTHGPLTQGAQEAVYRYLDCGIFACGFARIRCGECGHDFFVAFAGPLPRSGSPPAAPNPLRTPLLIKRSSYPSTLLGAERAYWNRKVRAVSQPRIADEASKSIRCGTAVEAP